MGYFGEVLFLMGLSFTEKKSIRKSFGKLAESLSIPNLIEVQKNSYSEFLKSKLSFFLSKTPDLYPMGMHLIRSFEKYLFEQNVLQI